MGIRTESGKRRPRVERLESRNLLAGDVGVEVTENGALLISGDDLANSVSIEAGENRGEYIITGQPTEDGDTTVNLQASFTAEGVTHGIRIRMGDGDDVVEANGLRVNGRLAIATGGGNDSVALDDVHVRRSLGVALGQGTDTASLDGVQVRARAGIRGGDGPDTVLVENSAFGRRLTIGGGPESDEVTVANSAARGLMIRAGAGDNTITVTDTNVRRRVSIFAGDGNDQITSVNTPHDPEADTEDGRRPAFWGGVRIVDRGGDNTVHLANMAIGRGGLRMHTGGGVDLVTLENLRVRGRTLLRTGGEADEVAIVDSVFARHVLVRMGKGDDILSIAGSKFRRPAVFSGGAGVDTFFNEENEFLGPLFENFELPEADPA